MSNICNLRVVKSCGSNLIKLVCWWDRPAKETGESEKQVLATSELIPVVLPFLQSAYISLSIFFFFCLTSLSWVSVTCIYKILDQYPTSTYRCGKRILTLRFQERLDKNLLNDCSIGWKGLVTTSLQMAQTYLGITNMEFLLPFLKLTEGDPSLLQWLSGLVLLWGLLAETGGRSWPISEIHIPPERKTRRHLK